MKNIINVSLDILVGQKGFCVFWIECQGYFGTIFFTINDNGMVKINSEYLSKDSVKEILNYLVDNSEFEY